MSEIKRVTLTTISDVVKKSPFGGALDQNTAADSFGGAFGGLGGGGAGSGSGSGKNAAGSKPRKTVRLALELFEPTAQSFPEFNFSKLMHEEQVSVCLCVYVSERGVRRRAGMLGALQRYAEGFARGICYYFEDTKVVLFNDFDNV